MKINKVTLTDYRNHAGEHTFEFTDGINLLLGRNGSGKSSILEALGLAMFNTGNRSSNDDAVNFSAKSAIINVDFEGIDGIQYIVEKKIGNTNSVKLFKKGEKFPLKQGVADVENKIKELAGIELSSDKIYENILTAYQNKMTDIFSDSGNKRQVTFNQIFNTAIYKEISDKFAKNAFDRYDKIIIEKNGVLFEKNSKLIDSVLLKSELEDTKRTKDNLEKEIELIVAEISEFAKSELNLKETKIQIDRISANIENNSKLLKNQNDSKTEAQNRLEISQKALEIVQSNEELYNAYLLKSEESNSVSKEIDKLEQKEKQKLNFERSLNSNLNEQTQSIEKSHGFELSLQEKQEQSETLKHDIEKLNYELETEIGLKFNLDKDLNILIKDKEIFDSFHDKLEDTIKNLENQNLMLSDRQKSKYDFTEIVSNILNLENNKLELNKQFNLKKELSNQIEIIKTRIKDNEDARKKLSTGICPFLKNDCLNLKSGSSAEDFFQSRKNELMKDLETYISELIKYSELDKLIADNDKNITLLKKQNEDGLKNESEIQNYQNIIDLTKKDIEIAELKIFESLRNYSDKIAIVFETKNFNEAENFFHDKISGLKEQSQIHNTKIQGFQKYLNQKNKEKASIDSNILVLNKLIEENINQSKILKEKEIEFKNQINLIEKEIKLLPELKQLRISINSELGKLKPGHDIYLANKKTSEEIPFQIKKLQDLEISIQKIITENEKLNISLVELSLLFSESKLEEIQISLNQKRIIEKDYSNKISEFNTIISLKKDALERNGILEIEILGLKKVIHHLDIKLNLTKDFRDKLKIMGKLVANRLLSKIEHIATENYRRISGRPEQITWTNDEKDDKKAYLVSLIHGQNVRKFEQLSGGEQVTVAISLRSAMASILTKAKFAIFDEPTNNLDSERKSALA
jgi:exonuclease SbcC